MRPDPIQVLSETIDEVFEFTANMTFEQFEQDRKTQRAVLANFTLIGAASNRVPAAITESLPTVPWPRLREMMSVVRDYFDVSYPAIWTTIKADFPVIRRSLQTLTDASPE